MNAVAEVEAPAIEFPAKLRPLFEPKRYKVLHGGRGGTKCLAIGTLVIMADGTRRPVEQVAVGESVMGPDSRPRRVLNTTCGQGPLWRVTQAGGAMTYVVNDGHILSVKKSVSAANEVRLMHTGNPRSPNGRYPTWPAVTNIPVQDYAAQSARWRSHFRGYKAGLIEFPAAPVKIDPYLLGVWLGDGTSREMRITSADAEVVDYCRRLVEAAGGTLTIGGKAGNKAQDIGFLVRRGRFNLLWDGFKTYGLPNNKHIPQAYLCNAESVRLSLLAGLIDTDGTRHHGGFVIAQVNERLAHDIKFLADGLGFKTSLSRRATICTNNGVHGHAWYVSITGDTWRVPCLLPHKRVDRSDVNKNKDVLLAQITVERAGEGEWAGFELDGDHLFLLADGTVTHNSWGVARALLVQAAETPLRVLCAREVQRSLRDSVHRLLCDQIKALGLEAFYDPLDNEIRGRNGSLFVFSGLATHTIDSIKSFEGVDRVWVEEAQGVSGKSWTTLVPTIRKEGSEIWMTLNPNMDTDETWMRFCAVPADDTVLIQVNWRDNPWFPAVLNEERLKDLVRDPIEYEHIWEGKPRRVAEGAIYRHEIERVYADKRVCPLPYDPLLPVHTVWDLGWNDAMTIAFVQRTPHEVRIIDYIEDSHRTLDWYVGEIEKRAWRWGSDFIPHDGRARNTQTGKSTYEHLLALGRPVKDPLPQASVEEGIKAARMVWPKCYFDTSRTQRLLECLKRYRRQINAETREPMGPLHDEYSHGADCFRYLGQAVNLMGSGEVTGLESFKNRKRSWR